MHLWSCYNDMTLCTTPKQISLHTQASTWRYKGRPACRSACFLIWKLQASLLYNKHYSVHIVMLHQFIIFQRGTPPAEACEKENNQPHIVLFFDEEEDSILQQYFVCVEQELMMESSNIVAAIFFCVAAHYIFNLSYHRKTGDVWLFIQEKILCLPSKDGVRRNPSSTSHFSGISRIFNSIASTAADETENWVLSHCCRYFQFDSKQVLSQ